VTNEMPDEVTLADRVVARLGSWSFILTQTALLFVWVVLNATFQYDGWRRWMWDPFPFILLNLALSFQAAYTGPIVLMSQTRAARHDRWVASKTLASELQSAVALREILERLDRLERCIGSYREEGG
jgi:uncharacterized membrane protein